MSFNKRQNNKQSKHAAMLSSLALNQQKVIVVNDKVGLEPQSQKLMNQWITEQKCQKQVYEVHTLEESSPFLLMRVAKLERRFNPSQIFRFVSRCKNNASITHLCVWVSENKLQNSFVFPYLEHMADTVITFEDNQHLTLLVKKSTGAVSNKRYQFVAQSNVIFITESRRSSSKNPNSASVAVEAAPHPATLGTFKIDLNDEEIKAKNALTLPFEFYKTTPEGGKILYHPDAEDDLDEEDPDDDLII